MRLEDSPTRGYARSAAVDGLMSMLTEDRAYPVNSYGETYGSALLTDIVGGDPDLLSAVNQDGITSYIRNDDVLRIDRSDAKLTATNDDVDTIPLYDVDGNVIGSFEIGTHEELNIDAIDIEVAKAAVEELLCR